MKVALCAIGALILLSSMTGIFNNLVVVDTSAQVYEKEDRNEKIGNNYNYEETIKDDDNMYNGYENSDEYSSYDNYKPSDYGKPYDSSYNNNDGYAAKNSDNNMEDKYSKYPSKDNKHECQRGPFQGFFVSSVEFCDVKLPDDDKSNQDKKFKCPDSGLIVDKRENCLIYVHQKVLWQATLLKLDQILQKYVMKMIHHQTVNLHV